MTTIIISILAALGIGGGVMLASSGGGGGNSGGTAVVAPVNPGGSGGGSNTGGSNTGGSNNPTNQTVSNAIPIVNSTISFSGNTAIKTGGILAAAPNHATLASRVSHANLQNGKITMSLNAFAPTLVSGSTYTTNETYSKYGNSSSIFMSGYKVTNPDIAATFDLTSIYHSDYLVDIYKSTALPASKTLPTLVFNYIKGNGETYLGTFSNATWSVNFAYLSLGGRQLGLSNSDFGYIRWRTTFAHADLDTRRGGRMGTQAFYIFDADKQLKANEYSRYNANNNLVTFTGNIVGQEHSFASCGNNSRYYIFGNITMSLNFSNKSLSGNLSNMKYSLDAGAYNFGNNLSFDGRINTNSNKPNFEITSMSGSVVALNSDGTFGQGVIVKGDSIAKDEIVGDLSFAYSNGSKFVNLAFGAKKQ